MHEKAWPLLRLLFQAPGDMLAWVPFYEALSAKLSGKPCVLTLIEYRDPPGSVVAFGVRMQRAAQGEFAISPAIRRNIGAVPVGTMFEIPEGGEELRATPMFQALFEPEGIAPGPGLGVVLLREGPRVSSLFVVLPKRRGWRPTPEDRALVRALAPFLPIATQLHQRLVGAAALTSILDHLVLGVVLEDSSGRVSYANRSAADLLGVEPGLAEPEGTAARDSRAEALRRLLDDEERALQVLSAPLAWPNPHGPPARRFARAHFLGDPAQTAGRPIGSLGELYGLTPAEAKLAWLLAGDRTLAEAARQLGIAPSTARTVLKRVLAKTGTRRQASLVRLLLNLPGQIRADAPIQRDLGADRRVRTPRERSRPRPRGRRRP